MNFDIKKTVVIHKMYKGNFNNNKMYWLYIYL